MISLYVPGPPVGKQRPRHARSGVTYTPKQTRTQEAFIRALFVQKYPDHVPLDGPVELDALIYFAVPKSASRKTREAMLNGHILPTKRPDISNVIKLAEDALNGVAYADDSQIVDEGGMKRYHTTPHIEIKIRRSGEEE